MKTLRETEIITRKGLNDFSICLNSTGNKITPFSTHIKIYEDNKNAFFIHGDYFYNIKAAMRSFVDRSKKEIERAAK